jgi:hypothetical protein
LHERLGNNEDVFLQKAVYSIGKKESIRIDPISGLM